jgi:hypothetical protein
MEVNGEGRSSLMADDGLEVSLLIRLPEGI